MILPSILNSIQIYLKLISIQIRAQLQYPVSFIFDVLTQGINAILFFVATVMIFQRFQSIGGWTLGEIAFLWGLIEMSFGTMDMIFSGFDPDSFSTHIQVGSFDQLLLRPINITLQVLGSKFVIRRLGRFIQGVIIFIIGVSLSKLNWTVGKIVYLPVVFISQILFFGGLFILGSTITFWTVQSVETVNILTYGGSEMTAYPMSIYPPWLRNFFTYIVPALFLNYAPALYFLNKPDPLHLPSFAPFLTPFTSIGLLMAALLFWRIGIQHYQGTGS